MLIDDVLSLGIRADETIGNSLEQGEILGDASLTMSDASPKRRREFIVGRACARRALERFGVTDAVLPRAPDGTVVWPPGYVGSITHTEGYCAAVVARSTQFSSLGLDAEVVGTMEEALEAKICSPSERKRLPNSSTVERSRHVTLIFSAKEAFYKWQYPLTGQWLDFQDVEIETIGKTLVAHSLVALKMSRGDAAVHGAGNLPLFGRFAFKDDRVLTIFAL